ncbi:MAG: NADH-quinone oxidoreductase subunit J [Actinomycetes bacterium]
MSGLLAADATTLAQAATSTGEAVTFWLLAPIAVLASLVMLFSRKAVHCALCLAVTMVCLAVLYIAQDAPFLGVVQVVVYTGAVMMLFLFVLMLVGVDASDSLIETLRGQRLATTVAGLGFAVLLFAGVGDAVSDDSVGLATANRGGNVEGIAELVFGTYVLAFEVTGALLITAALGAMVLAHREQHEPEPSQKERAENRFLRPGYRGALPGPGVYARHNAVDTPALLPDGTPAEISVSQVLVNRGVTRGVERDIERPRLPDGPRPGAPEPDHTSSQLGKGPTP